MIFLNQFINAFDQFRGGIATKYDKDSCNFLAAITLVASRIWIRSL